MTNLIGNNAYRILGLDITASQKEILKRSKEIINRLKIDDYPEYSIDIKLPKKFRTENSVKDALKRLQSTKESIKEYFFWFQISDTIDEKVLRYINKDNFQKAIETWEKTSKGKNSTSFFYKKNLAILYNILLFNEHNPDYLKEALSIWHDIISSDKFWASFSKRYNMHNEQTASSKNIIEIKNNVKEYISDVFTDLHQMHKKDQYIKHFQDKFKIHGKKTEKKVSNPIYESIFEDIEKLEKIAFQNLKEDISDEESENEKLEDKCDNCGSTDSKKFYSFDDKSVLCKECDKKIGEEWKKGFLKIEKIIKSITNHFEKLGKKGLANNQESKIVRDRAANGISAVAISLHNSAFKYKESIKLLKIAITICGTKICKDKLSKDLDIITKNKEMDKKDIISIENQRIFSSENISFKNNFIEKGNEKVYYSKVTGISVRAVVRQGYLWETKEYDFTLISDTESISFSFKDDDETWGKILGLCEQLILPSLVNKLVKIIFEKGETIEIGGVEFDNNGFHRSSFFGGTKSVLWSDPIYKAKFIEGKVVLFKDKNNSGSHFASISLEDTNAYTIPWLIEACLEEYHIRKQK